MSATSSVCSCVPQPGNSAATIDAKPRVIPAWEIRPVQTYFPVTASTPDARKPKVNPSLITAILIAATASASRPTVVSAPSCSDAPTATKKITRMGGAPRCTAALSASPCATARFSITRPAVTAASSGSNCCVVPTWLSSPHITISASVTSRAI